MSDLTPDDVKEILRLVEEAGYGEFELETPRFSVSFRKDDTGEDDAQPPVPADGTIDVVAPMVGTFYRSPEPGAPPFVDVGTRVTPETHVCIIEVMKLMSSVVAGVDGVVAEVCRENGTPVEYGDVLFRIRPA